MMITRRGLLLSALSMILLLGLPVLLRASGAGPAAGTEAAAPAAEPAPLPLELDPALGAALTERALSCYVAEGGAGTAEDRATLEAYAGELAEGFVLTLRPDECAGAACAPFIEGLECPDLARRLAGVGFLAPFAEGYTAALRDRVVACFTEEEGGPPAALRERLELFRVGLSRALTTLTDEGTCRVDPQRAARCAAELGQVPCAQLAEGLTPDPHPMLRQLVRACDEMLDCAEAPPG